MSPDESGGYEHERVGATYDDNWLCGMVVLEIVQPPTATFKAKCDVAWQTTDCFGFKTRYGRCSMISRGLPCSRRLRIRWNSRSVSLAGREPSKDALRRTRSRPWSSKERPTRASGTHPDRATASQRNLSGLTLRAFALRYDQRSRSSLAESRFSRRAARCAPSPITHTTTGPWPLSPRCSRLSRDREREHCVSVRCRGSFHLREVPQRCRSPGGTSPFAPIRRLTRLTATAVARACP